MDRTTSVLFVNTKTRPPLGADTWVHAQIIRELDWSAHDLVSGLCGGPTGCPHAYLRSPEWYTRTLHLSGRLWIRVDRAILRPQAQGSGRERPGASQSRGPGRTGSAASRADCPHQRPPPRCPGVRASGQIDGRQVRHTRPRGFRRMDEPGVEVVSAPSRCARRRFRVRPTNSGHHRPMMRRGPTSLSTPSTPPPGTPAKDVTRSVASSGF